MLVNSILTSAYADKIQQPTLGSQNGKSYLFDAGAGMTRSLAGAKVSLLDIQKIFLTHLHDDHYSGLGDFAGQLSALKPEKTIDIYGPGLTKSVVESLHDLHVRQSAHPRNGTQIRAADRHLCRARNQAGRDLQGRKRPGYSAGLHFKSSLYAINKNGGQLFGIAALECYERL
jgi:ribonuclease BN (tRNA processing enzyme)